MKSEKETDDIFYVSVRLRGGDVLAERGGIIRTLS